MGTMCSRNFFVRLKRPRKEKLYKKVLDNAPKNAWLCAQCASEFEDAGELIEDSLVAEEIIKGEQGKK